MLIGAGPTFSLLSIGQINLSRDGFEFYLQKTRLGWIFGGGIDVTHAQKVDQQTKCFFYQNGKLHAI